MNSVSREYGFVYLSQRCSELYKFFCNSMANGDAARRGGDESGQRTEDRLLWFSRISVPSAPERQKTFSSGIYYKSSVSGIHGGTYNCWGPLISL